MTTIAERLMTLHQAFIDMSERLLDEMNKGADVNKLTQLKQGLKDISEEIIRVEKKRESELNR